VHWLRFIALFTLFKVIKWSESFMATLKNEIIFGSKSKPFWIPHLMFCFISEKFYWRKQSETPIRTNCQNTIQTWSQVFYCILFKRVFLAKIPLCHKTRPSNNRLVFKIEFFIGKYCEGLLYYFSRLEMYGQIYKPWLTGKLDVFWDLQWWKTFV
jgi:hypothetical protein